MTTIPALIRALHAAGWHHTVTHEPADRDWETGAPEGDGYRIHRWTRRLAAVEVCWSLDSRQFIGPIVYGPADAEELMCGGPDTRVQVGTGWVERHGAGRLYGLGVALGVFETPAPVVLRPVPVGSWWETPDGPVHVDGDYLDGPGDQIVTYTFHRPDGSQAWGKWGGREFADAYTRLDGPPAWFTPASSEAAATSLTPDFEGAPW